MQATVEQGRPCLWRIVLEDPHTAERSGFRSLAELEAFLAAWMREEAARKVE